MYNKEYQRWLEAVKEEDLLSELKSIEGNDEQIKDRFLLSLEFGTAGLRGVLGAGTNRMNVYTVAKATQGLAEFLKAQGKEASVAVSYDSRIKSDVFAKITANVLAANGIKVYLYDALKPVPMLSFATRRLGCDAGVMVTASHNPAKYNGYKVYGPDGCQMTSGSADKVLAEINKLDIFADIKYTDFDAAVAEGKIEYISKDVEEEYYNYVLGCMLRKDIFTKEDLKIVYSPLNGSGNVPVRTVLGKAGLQNITVVKEQEMPDGNFPTCPYPNPEIREAMQLGLDRLKELDGDILIATDPDADRVGIAVKENDDYVLISGNQVGILLTDYIAKTRKELGCMPENPVMVKSIVSSSLADEVAKSHGVEMKNVLTGFKYIGEQIALLEAKGEEGRFILGFEESYGYLVGTHARDKDAVVASMLIAEMAAYYSKKGKTLYDVMQELYKVYGGFAEETISITMEGSDGIAKIKAIMEDLRNNKPEKFGNFKVDAIRDYKTSIKYNIENGTEEKLTLPTSDVLYFELSDGASFVARPSGTEPKIKLYFLIQSDTEENAKETLTKVKTAVENYMNK